jgi:hypothetical protein
VRAGIRQRTSEGGHKTTRAFRFIGDWGVDLPTEPGTRLRFVRACVRAPTERHPLYASIRPGMSCFASRGRGRGRGLGVTVGTALVTVVGVAVGVDTNLPIPLAGRYYTTTVIVVLCASRCNRPVHSLSIDNSESHAHHVLI